MSRTVLSVSRRSAAQVTRNLILEQAGYRVLAAGDAEEALRLLERHEVQAVVLADSIDCELGNRCKRLKPRVPIVMLCRSSDSRERHDSADEHVDTLDDPKLFLEALERALLRHPET